MALLAIIIELIINIILLLIAAWIGSEHVPQIVNGTAGFWDFFWTAVALMFVVSAGVPARKSSD